jgi:hypothetical protein
VTPVMVVSNWWKTRVGELRAASVVTVIIVLTGCGLGKRHIEFREQILLASGEILTATRVIDGTAGMEIGGPGDWEVHYVSLEVSSPESSVHLPKWESTAGLLPVLLDKDPGDGEWSLLATFGTCDSWFQFGRPKIPYAEFQLRGGKWQRVEMSLQWIGRQTNVWADVRVDGEPQPLTLAEKKKRFDLRTPRWFMRIEDHWIVGC